MSNETIGDIVISPRVIEVITGIAATTVEGVHSLHNKAVTDGFSKANHGKGVYLQTLEDGQIDADLYVNLQFGVNVPAVSIAIQQAVKTAVYDMAEVEIDQVNIHVVGIVPEKTPKPELKSLFEEDFLDD